MNRLRLPPILALPVAAALISACGERPGQADSDSAAVEYPREVLQAHMKDHFFKATEIQVAVINGDLEAVRDPATWMAEHANSAAMPPAWSGHAEEMHAAARAAADAEDLEAAARATARMGAACGTCHRALGAEVGFAVEAAPAEGEGAVAHMPRHAWASGRMWEGLIAPSEPSWAGGAEVLMESPLSPSDLSVDIDVLADVSELERKVHSIGAEAATTGSQEERARVYGEFLATCAACHLEAGRGPI